MLIRSWNLFNGNASPPEPTAFIDDELDLAMRDDPDVLCAQEVPPWALRRFTAGDVAARPSLGPLPIPAALGRRLTELNNGLLRSAFAGQGNAVLVAPRLRVLAHSHITLNPRRFRDAQARTLGLDVVTRLSWAKERRVAQAVRIADGTSRTFLVANLHCTSYADERLADAELLRAAWFATTQANPHDVVVLAGDFNVTAARSRTLHDLVGPDWGFSAPGPGIDHILVRGAEASPLTVWPLERRVVNGRLLSDHAPVELTIA